MTTLWDGRGAREGMCVSIADSICCIAETSTHCKAIILFKEGKDA